MGSGDVEWTPPLWKERLRIGGIFLGFWIIVPNPPKLFLVRQMNGTVRIALRKSKSLGGGLQIWFVYLDVMRLWALERRPMMMMMIRALLFGVSRREREGLSLIRECRGEDNGKCREFQWSWKAGFEGNKSQLLEEMNGMEHSKSKMGH